MNGLIEWVLFLSLSAIAIITAAGMILTMSMYRAGLALMASFVALAGLFILLNADLLAAIQVMMNVGGMLAMVLFMVMMMIDPGGEMMWGMKRDMHMPGPAAFSMHMPRGKPPEEQPALEKEQQVTAWTCPMHTEISQVGPGTCPKCGMTLIPRAEMTNDHATQEQDIPAKTYTCPMHPEVRQSQPGSCPKCGMTLIESQEQRQRQTQDSNEKTYTCPMHPEVQQNQPGNCPTCGMTLVESQEQRHCQHQGNASTTYTCPMHPEVQQNQPGSCPKCGMTLIHAEEHQEHMQDGTTYTCPMHPEVRQSQPGTCPKCGMTLIEASDSSQSPAQDGHEGMPMEHADHSMHSMAMNMHAADGGGQAMDMSDHDKDMFGMTPRQYYDMMVDMAMSTAQLPWAIALGIASALLLIVLMIQTPWPLSPSGPTQDATNAVGQLLLSRYMIGFEGAAYLILAGIAGAVLLAKRESTSEQQPEVGQIEPQEQGADKQLYSCPMHPEVCESRPGNCPKCGMHLIPVEEPLASRSQTKQGGHS